MDAVAVHAPVPLRSGDQGHVSFWSLDDVSVEIMFSAYDLVVVFDLTAQSVDEMIAVLESARAQQKRAPFFRYLRKVLDEKRLISIPARDDDDGSDDVA